MHARTIPASSEVFKKHPVTSATTSTDTAAGSAAAPSEDLPGSIRTEVLRGGDRVLIRPIHKVGVEMGRRFIEALSPQSRRFRFLETLNSPSDELLEKLAVVNPLTDMAYVAVQADVRDCEFAAAVRDDPRDTSDSAPHQCGSS